MNVPSAIADGNTAGAGRSACFLSTATTLIVLTLALLLSCAPAATTVSSVAVGRIADPTPHTLSEASLHHALRHILAGLQMASDTSTLSAPPESTENEPDARNLSRLYRALRELDITVLTVSPSSFEMLYALTSLPVMTHLILLHFDDRNVQPLERDRLLSAGQSLPTEHAERLRIHTVARLRSNTGVYTLETFDGLTVEGLPADDILGHVFPTDHADESRGYAQVVGHFAVSRLPRFDIDAHLEEWFHQLPYQYGVPTVRQPH